MNHLVLYRVYTGKSSQNENIQFDAWINQNAKNKQFYAAFKIHFDSEPIIFSTDEIEEAWEQFKYLQKHHRVLRRRRLLTMAASVAILVTISALSLRHNHLKNSLFSNHVSHIEEVESSNVILTLGDGTKVDLANRAESEITNNSGEIVASSQDKTLKYETKLESENKNIIQNNTINVPRGKDYSLLLADGTKVWLNANSSLEYPVDFQGETRDVYLKGEACFHVKENSEKMFRVHTNTSMVQVYGTIFNVSNYTSDKLETVTLESGSVSVLYEGKEEIKLHPDEQISYNKKEHVYETEIVDAKNILSWTEGIIRFDQMPLYELTKKLSRWYDVDFQYLDQNAQHQALTGAINKESDIEIIVKLLKESTAFHVVRNGKTISIASSR